MKHALLLQCLILVITLVCHPCDAQMHSDQVKQGLDRLADLHTAVSSEYAVFLQRNYRAVVTDEQGQESESLAQTIYFKATRDDGKDTMFYGMTNSPTDTHDRNLDIWEFRLRKDGKDYYYKDMLNKRVGAIPLDERPLKKQRIYYKEFAPLALPVANYWAMVGGFATEDHLLNQCFNYIPTQTEMKDGKLYSVLENEDSVEAKQEMKIVMIFDPAHEYLPVEFNMIDKETDRLLFRTATEWNDEKGDDLRPIAMHYFVDDIEDNTVINLDVKFIWLEKVLDAHFDPQILTVVQDSNAYANFLTSELVPASTVAPK